MSKLIVSEEFLSQIELLQMMIKNNVAGQFGGNHRSKTYGSSCEFVDHRDYMEGDDISKINWNAYARFDKLYLKLFLDERQMHTRIYIDASRSMQYGDSKKAEQAIKVAATLAYLSVCEMDKVSIYAITGGRVEEIISGMVGKESYLASINKLNDIVFEGESRISEAILPSRVGYGDGMSVIISDFLTDEDYERAIDHLSDKKRHVLCVQLLSKEELNPQIRGKHHLYESENIEKTYRKNIDRERARAYKEALKYVTDRIGNHCAARGADYILASAEDTMQQIFFDKLASREVLK